MSLFNLRHRAAENAFEGYDFGDLVIGGTGGWLSEGEIFSRKVFLETEGVYAPSELASFQIIFAKDSAEILDTSCLLMSNGAEVGFQSTPQSEESQRRGRPASL